MRGMERSARRAGGGQEEAMFTALIRTVILYILIIAGVRLMGKRQVGELEPSELVLSLLIADLASVPMQDLGIPLHAGVVPDHDPLGADHEEHPLPHPDVRPAQHRGPGRKSGPGGDAPQPADGG